MATDSTLQKIADNLLAQFDKSHILSNLKMENPHLAFSLRAPSTSGWHGATERKRTVSRKKNTIGSHLRLFLSAKIP